jgi:cytochrome P450
VTADGGRPGVIAPSETTGRTRCLVDHHRREYAVEAHDLYRNLRETCPVGWSDAHGGFWVVSRHQDAISVLRDPATYQSGKELRDGVWYGGDAIPSSPRPPLLPLELDPPLATKYRQLVMPWLTRTVVESHAVRIHAYVGELIDRVIEKGRVDPVSDLGGPLSAMVVTLLLGLDPGNAERIAWPLRAYQAVDRGSAEFQRVIDEMMWLSWLLRETCERRRAEPRADAISRLVAARVDGQLVPIDDCVGILQTVIGGAVDTTTAALAHSLLYLDGHRDDRARLAADPSLIPHACEEFLRAFPPVRQVARRTGGNAELAGQHLAPKECVMISVLSANYDESVFVRPDELDLDRRPNPHVTFGAGGHRCAGSHVARFMLVAMIGQVLTRMPDYRVLDEETERYAESGEVDGWASLPMQFTPGPRLGPAGGE